MNRGSAERAVAESSLSMAETLTMMMLLRRADNDTLLIPAWRTPSLPQLAGEVRVSVRWQRDLLIHLGEHSWVKVSPGRGRGHKSSYALLPLSAAGEPCACHKRGTGKHRKTEPGQHRKRGTGDPLSGREKGNWDGPKRGTGAPLDPSSDPVSHQGHQGGSSNKGGLACIGGCGKPARRACRTCWECARLEAAG